MTMRIGSKEATLRTATLADRADLIRIAGSIGLFEAAELDELTLLMPAGTALCAESRWIVRVLDNEVIGLAYYGPEKFASGSWNLYLLAVEPRHQGHGHGAALVGFVEDTLRREGQRLLLIETTSLEGMELTRRFYFRCGYEEEGTIRDFFATGVAKVIYRKLLNAGSACPRS